MEETDFESLTEKLREHLDSSRQNWLFGAGISYNSNIPLMVPLTIRVKRIIAESKEEKDNEIYEILTSELDEKAHIEHYLSHLGDLIALAERSKTKSSNIGESKFSKDELIHLYKSIIVAISDTLRYGYSSINGIETVGKADSPIVEIEHHVKFVQAVYKNRSNLTSRSKLIFFTTNYDTLLEDALALEKYDVIDGFSGGAVGYWNPKQEFGEHINKPNNCMLFKLHGSIDWQKDKLKRLVRVRYGTKYLANQSDIMIYPQATKYVETQKDPFSYLFSGFRNALNSSDGNVLITCGYSFGDEHINTEIEAALSTENNQTTLIAFIQETPEKDGAINKTLDSWLANPEFGNRIWVAGKQGIYNNSINPVAPSNKKDLNWWTFSGLTNFILTNEHE